MRLVLFTVALIAVMAAHAGTLNSGKQTGASRDGSGGGQWSSGRTVVRPPSAIRQ